MKCEQAQPHLNAWVDGELPFGPTGLLVRAHAATCPECAAEVRNLRRLTQQARSWRSVSAPASLRSRLSGPLAAADLASPMRSSHPMRLREVPKMLMGAGATAVTAAAIAGLLIATNTTAPSAQAQVEQVKKAVGKAKSAHVVYFAKSGPQAKEQKKAELWYQGGKIRVGMTGQPTRVISDRTMWTSPKKGHVVKTAAPGPQALFDAALALAHSGTYDFTPVAAGEPMDIIVYFGDEEPAGEPQLLLFDFDGEAPARLEKVKIPDGDKVMLVEVPKSRESMAKRPVHTQKAAKLAARLWVKANKSSRLPSEVKTLVRTADGRQYASGRLVFDFNRKLPASLFDPSRL